MKCLLLSLDANYEGDSYYWPEVVGWFDSVDEAKLAAAPADRNGKVWSVSEWEEIGNGVLEVRGYDFRIYCVEDGS